MSSSPMRGNEPGDLSVSLGPKTQWPNASRSSTLHFISFYFQFQNPKTSLFLTKPENPNLTHQFLPSLLVICTKKTHPCVRP